MTTKQSVASSAGVIVIPEASPAPEMSADPFADVVFETQALQHARRLLAPFVAHRGCEAECGCGLREAVAELVRIDGIGRRYGNFEP